MIEFWIGWLTLIISFIICQKTIGGYPGGTKKLLDHMFCNLLIGITLMLIGLLVEVVVVSINNHIRIIIK